MIQLTDKKSGKQLSVNHRDIVTVKQQNFGDGSPDGSEICLCRDKHIFVLHVIESVEEVTNYITNYDR